MWYCGGQVLYFIADNQLSGKLETAIQSLDNLTKVYNAFVNAKPVPGSPAVTPESQNPPRSLQTTGTTAIWSRPPPWRPDSRSSSNTTPEYRRTSLD